MMSALIKPFLLVVLIGNHPAYNDASDFDFDTAQDCATAATLTVGLHNGEINASCYTPMGVIVSTASRGG